jgi:Hpt domain.
MTSSDSSANPLMALRQRFLARAADDLAWIRGSGGAPADELLARAHKLAGSGGVFGHPEVTEAAAAVEDALRAGETPDLAALTAALEVLPPPAS